MASTKVTVRPCKVRGVSLWRVRRWESGKPKRTFFKSKTAAEAEAASLRRQVGRSGEIWLSLTGHERDSLIQAFTEAKRLGIDLREAIAKAKDNPGVKRSPTIAAVVTELLEAKLNAGRSDDYIKSLKSTFKHFSRGIGAVPIDKVTFVEVEKFLESKKLNSRSTLRSRLSTLFRFAMRRDYMASDPCSKLEPITLAKLPPAIFTTAQFKTAVEWILKKSPSGIAWFALSSLCGLRPEEAEKTVPKRDIHFREGFIRIEAQTTKVRQRRVVYPKPEAMRFLKWSLKRGVLPLDPQARKRMLAGAKWKNKNGGGSKSGLREALGFRTWPKDITRHTAASYWLADGATAGHVSEMLGNSEKVLKRDYKALVTRAQAKEFWNLVATLSRRR